jgi:putative endonuclease
MQVTVYIIADDSLKNLHVGMCSKLANTIRFYAEMPTLFYDESQKLNKLLFYQTFESEEVGMLNYKRLSILTKEEKLKLIKLHNSTLTDLTYRDDILKH